MQLLDFLYLRLKTTNLVKRRLILSYLKKLAGFLDDIKTIEKYKKYFVTEKQAKEKIDKLISENKPIKPEDNEWYEQTLMEEFYVYQMPSLGISQPLYGVCYVAEFVRRGYDDPVCLAGVYKADDNGNPTGTIMGYKKIDGKLSVGIQDIEEHGIKGYGKQYNTGDSLYKNLNKLKTYVQKEIDKRDNKDLEQSK